MSREAKARPQVSLAENRRRRHASSHLSLCTPCVPKDKIKVHERVKASSHGTSQAFWRANRGKGLDSLRGVFLFREPYRLFLI